MYTRERAKNKIVDTELCLHATKATSIHKFMGGVVVSVICLLSC